MNELTQRVTELEELYSHQQKLLQELNDVVVSVQREMGGLRKENEKLREKLDSAVGGEIANDRPPHY